MLLYDYRGYGLSQGELSEESVYADLETVLSYAVHQLKFGLRQILLWGFSLGSCPTVEIAQRYQSLCGVILEAPLASVYVYL